MAWRIECAADAEIVRRQEERGKKAVLIEQVAEAAGVAPSVIYRNAQIAQVVGDTSKILGAQNLSKQMYEEAIRSPEPIAAVAAIVEKKAADPSYSTRDARRDIAALPTS